MNDAQSLLYEVRSMKDETLSNLTDSSATLNADSLRNAIAMLRKQSKEPFITHLKSKYEWWKLLERSIDARNFTLYGGIPCYTDENLPANIVRFVMSDGTYTDIPITNRPKYLFHNTA